jgi:hypothetical protein
MIQWPFCFLIEEDNSIKFYYFLLIFYFILRGFSYSDLDFFLKKYIKIIFFNLFLISTH